jgi:hypothetical protein
MRGADCDIPGWGAGQIREHLPFTLPCFSGCARARLLHPLGDPFFVGNSVGNKNVDKEKRVEIFLQPFETTNGGPNGIRTRVTDVRGQCPRPLDDGTTFLRINC